MITTMHVYLRSVPTSRLNVIAFAQWPMATAWCGKQVKFSETVNLRGYVGSHICEACARAIEHASPGDLGAERYQDDDDTEYTDRNGGALPLEPFMEAMPLPRWRPSDGAEERAGRERAEEDRFDYLKDEGLLRRR